MFLVSGCANRIPDTQTEKVNVPNLNEKKLMFESNSICLIDWSNPDRLSQIERDYVTKWVEQLWREDPIKPEDLHECIDTQANAKCYLLYAMYNNQPELCGNFNTENTVEYFSPPSASSGADGGTEQLKCRYREICYAFVEIFNEK